MSRIVAVHSHRGGVGTTCVCAQLAARLARAGRRVGIVDLCLRAPDLHTLFQTSAIPALNDFLWYRMAIAETAIDVGPRLSDPLPRDAAILLLAASPEPDEIARILQESLNIERLAAGLRDVVAAHGLDLLVLDTPGGFNDESLLAASLADCLLVLQRPDRRHAVGTGLALGLMQRLEVPQILIALNKVPLVPDHAAILEEVARTCRRPVSAVLPTCDILPNLGDVAAPASAAGAAFAANLHRIAKLIDGEVALP